MRRWVRHGSGRGRSVADGKTNMFEPLGYVVLGLSFLALMYALGDRV
jgi:hypothetical protein